MIVTLPSGQRDHLQDVGHRANLVEVFRAGVFLLGLGLRHGPHDALVDVGVAVNPLDEPDGLLPHHRDGNDHAGKEHRVPDGHDG